MEKTKNTMKKKRFFDLKKNVFPSLGSFSYKNEKAQNLLEVAGCIVTITIIFKRFIF